MISTHTTVDHSRISEGRTPRSVVTTLPATINTLIARQSNFGRDNIESTLASKFPEGTKSIRVSATSRVRSSLGTIGVRNPVRDSSIECRSRGCSSRSRYCTHARWKPPGEVPTTVVIGKRVSTGAGRTSEVTVAVIFRSAIFWNARRFNAELIGKTSARGVSVALVHAFIHGVSPKSIAYGRR